MAEPEKVMVEVAEPVSSEAPVATTPEEGATAGLDAREVTMGKETGVLVEGEKPPTKKAEGAPDPEPKKDPEPPAKDPEKAPAKDPKEPEKPALPTQEEAATDPVKEQVLLKTYNANEKALYWKQKKEKLGRQAAERRATFLETQNEALRRLAGKAAPDVDADLKKDLEELDDPETPDPEKPLTRADLDKIEKDKQQKAERARESAREINERLDVLNAEAKEKYPDFDEVMGLAHEVMTGDKHGVFATKLIQITADPEGNPAEYAYTLGKLHPNYGKHRKEITPDPAVGDPKKVEKIIENAKKPVPTAGLGGASQKGRMVSEDDLKVEDVAGMSQSSYDKLSQKTRDRLLRESVRP